MSSEEKNAKCTKILNISTFGEILRNKFALYESEEEVVTGLIVDCGEYFFHFSYDKQLNSA